MMPAPAPAARPPALAARRLATASRVALLTAAIVAVLLPFVWMLRTSIVPPDEVFGLGLNPLPESPTFDNYLRAWRDGGLASAMVTGAVVTGGILILQLLTVVPAAFAFAKLEFRGRDPLFLTVIASLLITPQVTAVPNFITIAGLGLVDTRIGLVLPFATSAFGIFLVRQYLITVPDSLLEAARIDGLSWLRSLLLVFAPAARPAIAAFTVFSFTVHWNDYLWPLLVARSPEVRTPPLALALFNSAEVGRDFGALTAGAAIVTLPVIVVYLLAQRRFVEGLTGTDIAAD